MLQSEPYVRIPKIPLKKGKSVADGVRVLARLEEIQVELMGILSRRGNPLWVPQAGEIGFRCWRDYQRSNHTQLVYPGTMLAQPDWFDGDIAGFNDIEHWCYLKHEEVALMRAINKKIPEEDLAWEK